MILRLTIVPFFTFLFGFAQIKAQGIPKHIQLPSLPYSWLDTIPKHKSKIEIAVGFKNGQEGDSIIYHFDGKDYPFWALEEYINALSQIKIISPMCILSIDKRIPFGQIDILIHELKYLGIESVFWRIDGNKGITPSKLNSSYTVMHYYYEKRKSLLPQLSNRYSIRFSFEGDNLSAMPPPPRMSNAMLEVIKSKKIRKRFGPMCTTLVEINSDKSTLLDGIEMDLQKLTSNCIAKLELCKSVTAFTVIPQADATFEDYICSYSAIRDAYEQVWEKAALENYQKHFHQLNGVDARKIYNDFHLSYKEAGSLYNKFGKAIYEFWPIDLESEKTEK